jgi:Bacterial capsule synthesis protein PGA_cap
MGDYYPFKEMEDYCKTSQSPEQVFGELLPLIERSDLSFINLEFPITDSNHSRMKYGPNLKGDSSTLLPISKAKIKVATFSNNHTLDYGKEGLNDTIKNCKNLNIDIIGCGNNLEEARRIVYYEKKQCTIAVLNFSENEFNVASDNYPGANPLNIINNIRDIQQANKNADHVVLIIHAGQDFCHFPPPFLIKQLRFYVEMGASAIFCHHSHYIAGYETYLSAPICYGLGNIIYPKLGDRERNKTLVVNLKLHKNTLKFDVIPCFFDNSSMEVKIATVNSLWCYNEQIYRLNSLLKDETLSEKEWQKFIIANEKIRYLLLLSGLPNIIFKIFRRLNALSFLERLLLINRNRYLPIWNIIRRETHKESVLHILKQLFHDYN